MQCFGGAGECLVRVKNGLRGPKVGLPLYPRKRTQLGHRAMSEKCQEATLERHPDGAFHCSAHAKTLASLGRQSPIAVQQICSCSKPAAGTSKLTYVLESNSLVSCDLRCGQEHH